LRHWKNFENRPVFDKVMPKILLVRFFSGHGVECMFGLRSKTVELDDQTDLARPIKLCRGKRSINEFRSCDCECAGRNSPSPMKKAKLVTIAQAGVYLGGPYELRLLPHLKFLL